MNLVPAPGDTAAMVSAREAFLEAGHLDFIPSSRPRAWWSTPARAPATTCAATEAELGIALDSSTAALRRAARRAAAAVGCDLWKELPLRYGVADTVLSIFSPRNGRRVRPHPQARRAAADRHARAGAPGRAGRAPGPARRWTRTSDERLQRPADGPVRLGGPRAPRAHAELSHDDALNAARMGPSAWHLDPGELEGRVSVLPEPLAVTAAVEWSRRGLAGPGSGAGAWWSGPWCGRRAR